MIYLVTANQELFANPDYQIISIARSKEFIRTWKRIQFDTETSGRDPHICNLLSAQFGSKEYNIQIVVDCATVSILNYKEELESKLLIGHNLKFDCQFLYKFGIVPRKVWDTMIVEQLLHLGFPYLKTTPEKYKEEEMNFPYLDEPEFDKKTGLPVINPNTGKQNIIRTLSYSLKAVLQKRLGKEMDKTVRGEIIWRGLDAAVIKYAAGDVVDLEDVMEQQFAECQQLQCLVAAAVENNFVPVIAYLEWCGIKLDEEGWKKKMAVEQAERDKYKDLLDQWILGRDDFKQYTHQELQLDLFSEGLPERKCTINWSAPKQVLPIFKQLGFNTTIEDKKTGESKESAVEKLLQSQRGICDEFLDTYFSYKEFAKVCSTYGQTYLDAINPITGRIHTVFRQLGAASGRMSCGSTQENTDLAKYKKLPASACVYPQLQNLPADEKTRSLFISENGNLFTSADYSALESRLGADIYNEHEMIEEYLHGSGDIHSLTAKICFPEELKGIDVKDIKKVRPDLRKKAKGPEFACQFGGGAKAIASSLGIPYEEAKVIEEAYKKGFTGITDFKAKGARFVKTNGYVVMCQLTGHKMFWHDFKKWRKLEDIPYWTRKLTLSGDGLREHQMAGAKWERMALNSPTQGSGIAILKIAMAHFFKWILDNNYFDVVKICDLVHDEACIEYPKELESIVVPQLTASMEGAAAQVCTKLPIPAEASTGTHWIH